MVDPLNHDKAIDAICGCAKTVTVLSYQEAIEGYLDLRGLTIAKVDILVAREQRIREIFADQPYEPGA